MPGATRHSAVDERRQGGVDSIGGLFRRGGIAYRGLIFPRRCGRPRWEAVSSMAFPKCVPRTLVARQKAAANGFGGKQSVRLNANVTGQCAEWSVAS